MNKYFSCIFAILFFIPILSIEAKEQAALFPFSISHDAPKNITNINTWENTAWRDIPAGCNGFIRVENGQFVNDRGRLRILGTNFCTSANLPEKEQAEQVAARLARFGINCVRIHHLDTSDIWGKKAKSQLEFDPKEIDKFDYLVYQLKSNGIYINLNLHCSRAMDDRDGFPGKDRRPRFDKGVDNFYPALIEVQKKYARDLLSHVNPYTKTAYKDEPAVAVVEINNENSVVREWTNNKELLDLPEPFASEFQKQWNEFLKKKYGTSSVLDKVWNSRGEQPGPEMLVGKEEKKKWSIETGSGEKFEQTGSGNNMQLNIAQIGKQSRHPQLICKNLRFEKGKPYTFSIRIKGDRALQLTLLARMDHDPWRDVGFSRKINVTDQWKTYTFTFVAKETEDKGRFDITYFSPGRYEFSDASLKRGGTFGLKDGESIESGTVPIIARNAERFSPEATDDFCEFLHDIEKRYWLGMYRFLKDEIGVRQPISGTQLYYGSTTVQAELDYIDVHRYWNHPHFPGARWDRQNWWLRNRALVNYTDTEIFPQLATGRVHGKPYTVSEYDSPFPNQYASEALPMIAAFAAFQDWDGIFHFAYSHSNKTFGKDLITGYFDMVGHPGKLAHLPACVALFVREDVKKARSLVLGGFDEKQEMTQFKKDRACWNFNFSGAGLDNRLSLLHRTALDMSGRTVNDVPEFQESDFFNAQKKKKDDQLFWDQSPKGRTFSVCTDHSILFTGFTPDLSDKKTFQPYVGEDVDLQLKADTRLGWQTISLVSVNANGFGRSEQKGGKPVRVLLVATGEMENSGMELKKLDGDKVTMQNWGNAPVLCEAVPMELRFRHAKKVRCFPLDSSGNRQEEIATSGASVSIGPDSMTLWYEIEIE